jgi:hypothetical protein
MSRLLTNLLVGLGSGLVGAVALTATHEALRTNAPRALRPGMDVLGMRALKKLGRGVGVRAGHGRTLRRRALIGDLVANTAFFALVARGRRPMTRGLTLGLLAGIGALALPPVLGLGRAPRSRRRSVQLETIGLYVIGGIAAAGVAWLARNSHDRRVLDEGRARAELVHEHVNTRDSGMIH